MESGISSDFADWIPIGVAWHEGIPLVDWARFSAATFDEPFFHQTVSRALEHPFNLAFRRLTTMETLVEIAASATSLAPSGFIFHMSRCGSTLVSRMLAAQPGTRVISEAGPIDAVLRSRRVSVEQRIAWLRAMIGVLGRATGERQSRFVIKMDAWQTVDCALVEAAFPGVPWIFVYRDPIEVLVSHLQEISYLTSAANAPALLGIPVTEAMRVPRAEYIARLLACICKPIVERLPQFGRLFNYTELPDAVGTRILPLFGFDVDEANLDMMQIARHHAKRPGELFHDDCAVKQRAADDGLREVVHRLVEPLYQRLERARISA